MGLNYLQSPDINQQFFWPIMTLIICVQTYKKFGLVAKIGVGNFVCLIYIQNVKHFFTHGIALMTVKGLRIFFEDDRILISSLISKIRAKKVK